MIQNAVAQMEMAQKHAVKCSKNIQKAQTLMAAADDEAECARNHMETAKQNMALLLAIII